MMWLATLVGCGEPESRHEPDPDPCNGASQLCARRFDQVAYATTHNAMSNSEEGWIGPNHKHPVSRQLTDGVRALMLDIHSHQGKVFLCHGNCNLGSKPLVTELDQIRRFLTANPREVLTIIFESYVAGSEVIAQFSAAGLTPYLHTQQPGQPWPTLQQLIASGRRLVVLTDRDGGAAPWYHDVWALAWETHWSNKQPGDFSCTRNRGKAGAALMILNHFLTNPVAMPLLAEQVNHDPLLGQRVDRCRSQSGQLPNFITVDFYSIGDLMAVVDKLNR